ncbi:Type Ii Inositol 1,4,5-Trisphosphate 5-Phosphatase [Manis pentadactyla]|nr:Type Ii Inositol 1,4,5-Trisphosphate 5-Phosphatase [Manis pentadactyla]
MSLPTYASTEVSSVFRNLGRGGHAVWCGKAGRSSRKKKEVERRGKEQRQRKVPEVSGKCEQKGGYRMTDMTLQCSICFSSLKEPPTKILTWMTTFLKILH